jgi:hypothetical protein
VVVVVESHLHALCTVVVIGMSEKIPIVSGIMSSLIALSYTGTTDMIGNCDMDDVEG